MFMSTVTLLSSEDLSSARCLSSTPGASTFLHTPIRCLPRLAMGRRSRDFLEGEKEGNKEGRTLLFSRHRSSVRRRVPKKRGYGLYHKWEVEHTT